MMYSQLLLCVCVCVYFSHAVGVQVDRTSENNGTVTTVYALSLQ